MMGHPTLARNAVTQGPIPPRYPAAARLAGGSDGVGATAGEPDCYRYSYIGKPLQVVCCFIQTRQGRDPRRAERRA
jgi:hypothetical protein